MLVGKKLWYVDVAVISQSTNILSIKSFTYIDYLLYEHYSKMYNEHIYVELLALPFTLLDLYMYVGFDQGLRTAQGMTSLLASIYCNCLWVFTTII